MKTKENRMLNILFLCTVMAVLYIGLDTVNHPFVILGYAFVVMIVFWKFKNDLYHYIERITITDDMVKWIYIFLFVGISCFIGITTITRYEAYLSYSMDLGIFAQMYEYMKETGVQYTTVERNYLLSHFQVHISPIYYLLLPLYLLVPHIYLLEVSQAILVGASLVPLFFLLKHYRFSNKKMVAIGICYACYAPLLGSCFYNFHENCFIPLLFMCLLLAVETKNNKLFIISFLLSLMIKEDIAVVLIFVGLFFLLSKKDVKRGSVLVVFSLLYFIGAIFILQTYGQGLLGYMENMYFTENGGMVEVIKAALLNPGYTIRQVVDTEEKIGYILLLIIPLNIGLLTKKYETYLLILPWILLNLIPDYSCVYSIYFQYSFSISVLLFYIVLHNISTWKEEKKKEYLFMAVMLSLVVFSSTVWQIAFFYQEEYRDNQEQIQLINEVLDEIEEDASVSASSLILPHLWNHLELYDLFMGETDYIIGDLRESGFLLEELRATYIPKGYKESRLEKGIIVVFTKEEK
ncbi:MAG: DUF2079 domain-containing protein [Lachnospiraceae bacterium]